MLLRVFLRLTLLTAPPACHLLTLTHVSFESQTGMMVHEWCKLSPTIHIPCVVVSSTSQKSKLENQNTDAEEEICFSV